ncbi:hypothetical protein F4803DRAFT_538441 [Xylaria telfairii]|nr:hypothetical protein F4803DRAFT_538441 [Xylaria telfairii]
MASPVVYSCSLDKDSIVVKHESPDHISQSLTIGFQRTIRVPDNADESQLPPNLGHFPLFKVSDFSSSSKLPADMAAKGGVFFPMYQQEAMWINFKAKDPFMIKVYAGGINAVSGEHNLETLETKMRRLDLVSENKNVQDYVVAPLQPWLDGFAVSPGVVRQFVAMPLGMGYTVEAQLTGQEVVGGLQLEITPSLPRNRIVRPRPSAYPGDFSIEIKRLTGWSGHVQSSPSETVENFKAAVQDATQLPPDQQRLVFNGKELEDGRILSDYNMQNGSLVHLIMRLRGGGFNGPMGVAAGGKIDQVIHKDNNDPNIWARTSTITIPVHILSKAMFCDLTQRKLPRCPISASDYARAGLPFFRFPEKPSGISGAFSKVKSVNEINVHRGLVSGAEPTVNPPVVTIQRHEGGAARIYVDPETIDDPHGLVNPGGPLRGFRTLAALLEELKVEDDLKAEDEGQ